MSTTVTVDAAQLSKMLFEARELIDMFGDIVKSQVGQDSTWTLRVRDEIDEFRKAQGWSPDGFGGEDRQQEVGS